MKKRLLSILLTVCMTLALLPTAALAAEGTLIDGWYNLRCMNNYLNIDSEGKAELRNLSENEAFYVTNLSDGHLFERVTLKMKDGRYLGLDGELKNGSRVVAVSTPYTWALNWENKSEIFSLRPPEYISKVLNASEEKNTDGTHIIIWKNEGSGGGANGSFNAPQNGEFRFIPVTQLNDTTGESYRTFKKNELYGYKDFMGNVVIPAQFDRAIDFSQGVALVSRPEKETYAFINTSGNPITPYKYEMAGTGSVASDGLISVCEKVYSAALQKALNSGDSIDHTKSANGVDTIVMKSGKKFSGKDITYKYGYINTKGQEVIHLQQANEINDFHDDMAAIHYDQRLVNGKFHYKIGWINKSGTMVIPNMSEDAFWYHSSVHDFQEGFACYFKASKDGIDRMPSGGIMDKTGKVIIPAEQGTFIDGKNFGLAWKDGIIAVAPYCKTNENGIRDAKGEYWWQHLYLYDYTGRMIVKPEGYTGGYPMGGGYTLSMYQPLKSKLVGGGNGKDASEYWSVFDRNGKKVVEKAELNNYYLLNIPYGYENGYVFFGETRIKVDDVPITPPKHPFTDVKADSYYEEAVIWAKDNGVTGGTSATTFAPDATCTRGQVVTFLWRAKGSPEPKSANNPFNDVKSGDYYYKAVLWAVEQGITGGTSANTFSPNDSCTSGEVVTFLWRSNGSPTSVGMDTPYYAKAVAWAAEKGLLDNMGGFFADKPSPRANIVTYLHRNAK